jgi:hypothetical protein
MRLLQLLVGAVPLAGISAQATPLPQQSPRIASYQITAAVDPAHHTVEGIEHVAWRNTGKSAVSELRFHLYWNAFRDLHSTFMRESTPAFRAAWREQDFGRIDVEHLAVLAEGDREVPLVGGFVQPDDGNVADQTVLQVALPEPVQPGGEIKLVLHFRSTLPRALRRFGVMPGGTVFLMHWYPVLGVLQEQGDGTVRWNCHQFHANSEFFADFANYHVSITLPADYEVGATGGVPVADPVLRDGAKTWVFEQNDVHNFAVVGSPDFKRYDADFGPLRAAEDRTGVCQRVAAQLGVPLETFDLPKVKIRLLLRKCHDTDAHQERYLEAVKVALEFYGLRYGPYPYPYVTAVDPGADVDGRVLGGGMEYPTLFTCGTPLFLRNRELAPEGVTVHECGHQFWYGLSANNEFEESWLDEGINTYSEGRAQWIAYRPEHRTTYGRSVEPVEVTRFSALLPLEVSRGPWCAGPDVLPRRDLPGIWRIPGFAEAQRYHFNGAWRPQSPLLDLLASQAPVAWHGAVPFEGVWRDRARLLDAHTPDAMVKNGWEYLDAISYGVNSYSRPATLLRTLERMLAPEVWWSFLREFHARSRFRHPTTAEFVALLEERCGAKAAAYFRSAIQAGAVLDYGIEVVDPDGEAPQLIVRRKGTMLAEVKVRLKFERGADVRHTISADDIGPVWRLPLRGAAGEDLGRLTEAWLDPPELPPDREERAWPAGVHLLDENLLDNAWSRERNAAPARHRATRALLQAQSVLSFAGWMGS